MKILVCSQPPSLYPSKSSPWKPRSQTFHPTTMQNLNHPTRTWKMQANAKGFSGPPDTAKEPVPRKNSNKNDGDDGEQLPKEVFERIVVRILISVGLPLAIGVGLLRLFDVAKEQHLWDVPIWLPFLTTFITFGTSTLGLAYGTLSSSWDAEKKGSLLGLEEAQQNWVEMWKEEDDSK